MFKGRVSELARISICLFGSETVAQKNKNSIRSVENNLIMVI